MSCSRLELGLGNGLKALPLCHCERDGKAGGRALVELSALPHAQFPRISGMEGGTWTGPALPASPLKWLVAAQGVPTATD